MITNFKIFEDSIYDEQCIGKFFIQDVNNYKNSFIKGLFNIVLVTNIEVSLKTNIIKNQNYPSYTSIISPKGQSFTIMKSGEISEPTGWNVSYTKKEFDNIKFLTPNELYKYDPDFYIKLYNKVKIDFEKNTTPWYEKMLKNYKDTLETASEFEFYTSSQKYNL